jgi:N-dimethylarginine dimethylaminohydrolase
MIPILAAFKGDENMTYAKSAPASKLALLDRPVTVPQENDAPEARRIPTVELDNSTPGTLDRPAFLMNVPFSLTTECPNNAWMRDLDDEKRKVDRTKAIMQFAQLYHHIASDAIVYLLPTPNQCKLQDLVFTANLGIVLEHIPGRNVAVLSNFTSEPRVGETKIGEAFFRQTGYRTVVAPHKFEGEADLKHVRDNIYIGGHGLRSQIKTYEWMEAHFDMKVIKVAEVDEYLYHLDCSLFPITSEDLLVCTELFTKAEIRKLEKYCNIINVSADAAYSGICNSVRYHNSILNSSHLHALQAGTDEYVYEVKKNRELEDIAVQMGLEINYFNLSEFHKSGALLSCMVMHLNRRSYAFSLI